MLLVIITGITLFVMALMAFVVLRYRQSREQTPSAVHAQLPGGGGLDSRARS